MAKIKGDEIDFTGVESGGGGGARVPEGDYQAKVKKIERGESKKSGNSMLVFTFEISKGKYKGKTLKRVYATLTVESLWKLKNILDALGISATKVQIKKIMKSAEGAECGITVVDDEYEGKMQSEIADFMDLETLESQSSDDDDDDDEDEKPKKKKKDKEEKSSKKDKKGKKKKKSDDDEEIEDLDIDV